MNKSKGSFHIRIVPKIPTKLNHLASVEIFKILTLLHHHWLITSEMPTLDSGTVTILVLGSLLGGVLLVLAGVCWIRRCRGPRGFANNYGYDQVNHGLDEEEIEFKNMIESKGLDFEDLDDDIFGEDKDNDLQFNSRDKDRLNMLETLRSNLVSSVNVEKLPQTQSDEEVSDNEQIRL